MKILALSVLFGIALGLSQESNLKNYVGSQVLTVVPTTLQQVEALKAAREQDAYDFWTPPRETGKRVDIMADRDDLEALQNFLTGINLEYNVKIPNLDEDIRMNLARNEGKRSQASLEGRQMEWSAYHTFDEINDWMDEMAVNYPELVSVVDAGVSYEGRTIKRLTVSTGGSEKPVIIVESGCHAREWIGPATTTFIMNELISNSSAYQESLNAVDFVFMPSVNPDGYDFTWTDDRLWRKNRKINNGTDCIGVDLNRNYDFKWGGQGSSDRACSNTYHGSEAFSEVESQIVRDQILEVADNAVVYISFHSALEEWLRPWSYALATPGPDDEDSLALCEASVEALYAVHGVQYICILGGDLYPCAGVSDDWAKGVADIKYSYAIELRDQGYGFQLPEEQIIPSGEETFAAFQVIFEFIRDNPSG